jgi:hypothetical protein
MEQANEIVRERGRDGRDMEWPERVAREVNDLSRIVHAEISLAELGIKSLIEREIDHSLKVVMALGFLLCAAVCAVGATVIGLHVVLGFGGPLSPSSRPSPASPVLASFYGQDATDYDQNHDHAYQGHW